MPRGSETIVVVRQEEDWQGDPLPGEPSRIEIENCIIWPRMSTEDPNEGMKFLDGLEVFDKSLKVMVVADDIVEARGDTYKVDGKPGFFKGKGQWIILKKARGG